MQPQHLFFRHGGYHYVIRIPRDLLAYFPQKALWRSLRTKDLKAAKVLLKVREHDAEKIFMQIRSGLLTDDQIKELVAGFLHGELASAEMERSSFQSLRHALTSVDANIDFISDMYGKVANSLQKDLARGDLAYGKIITDAIIEKHGLSFADGSEEYQKVCREVVKAEVRRLAIESRRTAGDYDSDAERFALAQYPPPPQKRLKLSDLVKTYRDDRIFEKKWSGSKTIADMDGSYALLLRVKGDFYIDDVTYDFAREFRSTLQRIPANSNKGRFRGKPVPEILAMPEITPMSISNYNKNIRRMSELFQFAYDKDLTTVKNYFKGLEVEDQVKDNEKRRPFTLQEIKTVLDYLLSQLEHKTRTKAQRFAITIDYIWIFLFGIYAGCRSNELCQLTTEDFIEFGGILCISIVYDPENHKTTKNLSSRRVIPVPQQMIDLGFLRFVELQKANRNGRLWKSVSMDSFGKWNRNVGRNINKYIDLALGWNDPTLVYHSTRHNLGNALDDNEVSIKTIQDIKGHTGSSTEERVYLKARVQKQFAAMSSIDYGLDLKKVKSRIEELLTT